MTDLYADWVTVVPGPEGLKATAQELLAIARDSSLVRTSGNGTTFLVAPRVADQYTAPPKSPAPRRRAKQKDVNDSGD